MIQLLFGIKDSQLFFIQYTPEKNILQVKEPGTALEKMLLCAILCVMKKLTDIILCASCATALIWTAGCNSTPVRQVECALLPFTQAEKAAVKTRAAALKKALVKLPVRGAGLTLNAYRNTHRPAQQIMSFVKQLGFNRIICYISSETELDSALEELVISASQAGIPFYLMLRQGDFKHRFRGNALVRKFLPQFRTLPDLAADITAFNEKLPSNVKLAGVTVRFEPHLFTYANGADKIPGLPYIWNHTTFGAGLDNDKLTELSLAQLRRMKKELKGLPLSVELPDFYPVWVAEKKLTRGAVKDFRDIGEVFIQCSGNRPTELLQKSKEALKGAPDTLAVIPLAGHTSVNDGALRRRNWEDFVRAVDLFINSTRKNNCSGVILRPLSELGYMLLEQD